MGKAKPLPQLPQWPNELVSLLEQAGVVFRVVSWNFLPWTASFRRRAAVDLLDGQSRQIRFSGSLRLS